MESVGPMLLPAPRLLTCRSGSFDAARAGAIHLGGARPSDLWFAASQLQGRLGEATGARWRLRAGTETPDLRLDVDTESATGAEGYQLTISAQAIELRGGGPAGVFYGCQTLHQLLRQYGARLPCLCIEDAPDFPARGLLLDVSHDRVPTMDTLFALVDRLAEWKLNQLQLYTEHTFAYPDHEVVWRDASPLTAEEILRLDTYCRERFIDLVPNQASFGHLERWLKHGVYRHLAEAPDGWDFHRPWGEYWGRVPFPTALNPLHPGSLELLAGLYRDLLPHFSTGLFNVNCDETYDLGQGASTQAAAERGKPAVYFEFLHRLNELVQRAGRQMLYWADFYRQHPEAVRLHPEGAIALEWGYAPDYDFAISTARLAEAGAPFYVCPSTASFRSLIGRTDNAIANITSAAEHGLRNGALGLLNTDWGNEGHPHHLPVSYLGIGLGAASAWCLDAARTMPLAEVVSLHAFGDPTGETGRIAYDLGNSFQSLDVPYRDSWRPHWLLVVRHYLAGPPPSEIAPQRLRESIEYALGVASRWSQAQTGGPDADLVRAEFANNTAMWLHACRCGLALADEKAGGTPDWQALADNLQAIISEYHRLWLARNRPGGLVESAAILGARLEYYRARSGA